MANGDISAVLERARADFERREGVVGVSAGRSTTGADAIVVYVLRPDVAEGLPSKVDGVPVMVEVTGAIDAL